MPAGDLTALVFMCMTQQATMLIICPYGTYQLKGERDCYACPKCEAGSGLSNFCRRFPPYEANEEPRCIPCIDGVTFSNSSRSIVCSKCSVECSIEDNLMEVLDCTKHHDRLCQCKRGYFRNGTEGKCDQECCYCYKSSRETSIKKCRDDDMRDMKYCAPRENNGKCTKMPSYQTSNPTTVATKTTSMMTLRPALQHSIFNNSINHKDKTERFMIFVTRLDLANASIVSTTPKVRSSQRSASKFSGENALILVVTLILLVVLTTVLLYMKCRKPSSDSGQGESEESSEFGTRRFIKTDSMRCSCIPTNLLDQSLEDLSHQLQYEEDESSAENCSRCEEQDDLSIPCTFLTELTLKHKQRLASLLDDGGDWLPLGEKLANGNEELTYHIRNSNRVPRTSASPSKLLFRHLVKYLPNLTVEDISKTASMIGRENMVKYINESTLNNWMFSRLPFPHMSRLSYLLDQKLHKQGDWSELASALGVPREKIGRIRLEAGEPTYSPTYQILNIILVSCPLMTLSEIKNAAEAIERQDVSDCIDDFINGTVDRSSLTDNEYFSLKSFIVELDSNTSASEMLLE